MELVVIGGPTASGKNQVALQLARKVPSEIVNADSRQIYRDLKIGTNQPSEEDFRIAPHHLFGFLDPSEGFSAADYERVALSVIEEIRKRENLPIVTGGTGFYLKALLRGMWPVPPKDPQLRERLQKMSGSELYSLLKEVDPESAEQISPRDIYRVIRALEIYYQTGRKRSEMKQPPERFRAKKVFLDLEPKELWENIRLRTFRMFEAGWIEEVRMLLKKYPAFETMPAARSLGYAEVIRYLRSEMTLEECRKAIVQKTLQYAKRQRTWFRNQDGFIRIDSKQELHKFLDSVLE